MSKKDKVVQAKLIANPGAGKPEESAKQLELATRYLQQNGIEVDVALAKPKEEATPLAKQAVKDGYKIVIAMGGDGTLEAVLRGMVGSKVRLGIIPVGTANNMARSLGIPLDLEEACALIASGNTRKLDVGQVKVKKGKKLYFFELTAIGLVAALYPKANKISNGKLANIKDVALTLIHHEPEPKVYLTLDDESKIEVETMLVVVSNAPMFGANFLVAPDASLVDGLLDISVYPNFSKTELLGYYAKIRGEGYSANEKVQRYRARKLEIKTSPKMDVMADGVMLGKGKIEIKSRPASLWIITPQESIAPATIEKNVAEELPAPVSPVAETHPSG
ncbi:MAG TPA: diacylglycerol kinase family protein [Anaerolineales bacterium]|nr:diacylglycerol kinase family protein [Anaerolineales bacterium]HLO32664.1 diacylglycerol kinase family protein [Anaerolineales bacterium]